LTLSKKNQRIASILLILMLVLGNVPISLAQPQIPEIDIPVAPIEPTDGTQPIANQGDKALDDILYESSDAYFEEEPVVRTVDYTEQLYNVTDKGILDSFGKYLESVISDGSETPTKQLSQEEQDMLELQDSLEAYRQTLIDSWGGKKEYAERRLQGVKENLSEQVAHFQNLEDQIQKAETELEPLKEAVTTLESQIRLLNNQISTTKDKITNAEVLIAQKQIEIKDLMLQLKRSEIEMAIQEKIVTDFVRLQYAEEQQYFDYYEQGASTLKLLLADNSVSENLLGEEYLAIMGDTGRQVFYDLEKTNQELKEKQKNIFDEQQQLEFLYQELTKEKLTLEETRLSKKDLLEETQGQEEKYQQLLEQSTQEQVETALAIQNLQENVQQIEAKLDSLDSGLEDVKNIQLDQATAGLDETVTVPDLSNNEVENQIPDQETISRKPFIWPVPANKINAEFHDPNYPARWGVHNAIDIRAKQFTEIHAPANGFVFQTKDNGNGYSYIILVHKGNLVTVYGHVTEIRAKAGTIVKQGDVIGLTGGTPGTKGAGLQTTGPHLHFEVHYKGQPVNPLDYLPLEEMPIEYVPDEYLLKLK